MGRKTTIASALLLLAGMALLFSTCSLSGCSGKKAAHQATVGDGVYDLGAPLCLSTGEAPAYPDVAHRAALLDFTSASLHTLELSGGAVTESIQDDDCLVTVKRRLAVNEQDRFALSKAKEHVFTPEACTLTVQVADVIVELGKSHGAPFVDSADTDAEIPYTVAQAADGYELLSVNASPIAELWSHYGCAEPDQLKVGLTKR